MTTQQYITQKGTFDSGHRVMNERMKCFNVHGHTYLYEITFLFHQLEEIGYAIDFKEIKRIGCQWIDDRLDHGLILNPMDKTLIQAAQAVNSKLWLMSLCGADQYCNPSVENIAKEIFLAMTVLFESRAQLTIHRVKLHETPNCYTDCFSESISDEEKKQFFLMRGEALREYAQLKGVVEYDDRKIDRKI